MPHQQQQKKQQRQQRSRQQSNWMKKPAVSNCPPGLEFLNSLDQLHIKQKKEMMDLVAGVENRNRYIVRNQAGQKIFSAKEVSDSCIRQCCGPRRPFELSIEDSSGREAFRVLRPYKCMCCHQICSCCRCCFDEVSVEAPRGREIGRVIQAYGSCRAEYKIHDESGKVVLLLRGPRYCKCYCPGDDIPFELMSSDGSTEVGRVSKQWSNVVQEIFSDSDNFGITFPVDLDVKVKAVVLAACFLIDFMFFEEQNRRVGE